MKKAIVPFLVLPFFLFGCGKDKNVYASSKNTMYEYVLDGDEAVITGFNSKYKNQVDIIIPYSIDKHVVKRIEKEAFKGINRIKNVDMSKSNVKEIGDSAFLSCKGLVDIKLPDTLEKIENYAFSECNALETMDLSNTTLTEVSSYLFSKCESLTGVTYPSTVKIIGSNIYESCPKITKIDLSNITELEEIADYGFYNLSGLTSITLPANVKKLGDYSFAENKKVTSYNFFKTSIEEIGEGAFSKCSAVTRINLPDTVKKIGVKAMYYCFNLEKVDLSQTKLEVIPESCFELCSKLADIKIPNVTKIDKNSFYLSGIKSINIPEATEVIADDAFRLCSDLISFDVSKNNNNYIEWNGALYTADKKILLFYPASSSATDFTISDKTERINAYTFANAKNLKTIDLSTSAFEEIEEYTFMNCVKLETVKMIAGTSTEGIKIIGNSAFLGCDSLAEFVGQRALTEIGESAFCECKGLKTINLYGSNQLKKIGANAFRDCSKLESFSFSVGVETIGRSAFLNCNGLKKYTEEDEEAIKTITFGGTQNKLDELIQNNETSCLGDYIDHIKCN